MPFLPIRIKGKPVSVHKAAVNPDFTGRTVLVTDTWDYVAMWLKRHKMEKALFYWEQAQHFFLASMRLPKISSPLTAYYCFLNATKTLLLVNNILAAEVHGLTGQSSSGKVSLLREMVTQKTQGVAPALSRYFKEPTKEESHNLKAILYNLPYIHRAYNLTFHSQPELFFPITKPRFVRKKGSDESWFCAEITDPRYRHSSILEKMRPVFEKDTGVPDNWMIRKKKRFQWKRGNSLSNNLSHLAEYHRKLRCDVKFIYGATRLWYIKRSGGVDGIVNRSTLSLTLWAMYRLSELARYQPTVLQKHFASGHNWLLSEFIATAPHQFIDGISSEITGQEFMVPGRRTWQSD